MVGRRAERGGEERRMYQPCFYSRWTRERRAVVPGEGVAGYEVGEGGGEEEEAREDAEDVEDREAGWAFGVWVWRGDFGL